ncbi:MAG: glutamate racemase [Candidatus Paceibacterota bacterium]|jgi:glutamate racemase
MKKGMRIGIFDSGLGGLIIARAIRKTMPEYDYVYFGDTKRLPYGNKSHEAVYEFTKNAVDYLFRKENCTIVIIACNTASARALRELQQKYLPKKFKDRKILGVLIPTAEIASNYKKIGILATLGTVASNTWIKEIKKINNKTKVFQNPAPMLAPLVDNGENIMAKPFLLKYLNPFKNKKLDALVLGCTHYPMFKKEIRKIIPKKIKVISQDEIIPKKLKEYLKKHPEITQKLSKNKTMKIFVTDQTQNINIFTKKWFGKIKINIISDSSLFS